MKVLDHGFVKLRNLAGPWGDADDIDPANCARMSFDQMDSSRTRSEDLKLCDYLMRNEHSTPFEMIVCWVEMKMPIFVARQFVRHRTVSINEVSGRYVTLPAEWYIPEPQIVGRTATSVKQGRLIDGGATSTALEFCRDLDSQCRESYRLYLEYIKLGIPNEVARNLLHLNHYTRWLWKQDLHNMMHFLSLRDHRHAQYESQQYAIAIDALIRERLPECMALYDKYRRQPL